MTIICAQAGVTSARCTKTCCHDTWDLHIHSIHQHGGVIVMLHHISRDSEIEVLLKQSHTIIKHGPKSPVQISESTNWEYGIINLYLVYTFISS